MVEQLELFSSPGYVPKATDKKIEWDLVTGLVLASVPGLALRYLKEVHRPWAKRIKASLRRQGKL